MYVIWSYMCVYWSYVCFGRIVCHEFRSRMVVKFEVHLRILIEKPEISHFHRSRALPFDRAVNNSYGRCVVDVYWCWRLGMFQFGRIKLITCASFVFTNSELSSTSADEAAIILSIVHVIAMLPFS